MNYSELILEEIALDGLDGCTLSMLWVHLAKRNISLSLDEKCKRWLWNNIIIRLREVDFYEVPNQRGLWQERVAQVNDFGVEIYEPCSLLTLLPCHYVEEKGIQGSCSTYRTRRRITEKMRDVRSGSVLSYDEVLMSYGDRLVLVASQKMRDKYLMLDSADPLVVKKRLTPELYCYLEMMGRGRYEGVYGSDAFTFLNQGNFKSKITHGSMGYLRKKLATNGLIVKTTYMVMKRVGNGLSLRHDNVCFLTRFFRVKDTAATEAQRKIEQYLLTKPKKRDFLTDVCVALNLNRKKTLKYLRPRSNFFDLYYMKLPEGSSLDDDIAAEISYLGEASVLEESAVETCQVIEVKPELDVDEETKNLLAKRPKLIRTHLIVELKMTIEEASLVDVEEEPPDEDESQGDTISENQLCTADVPSLVQIVRWIDSLGPEGATRNMLRNHFGLHTLQARQMMKSISRKNILHVFFTDCGRQKVERVCSLKYAANHDVKGLSLPATEARKLNSNAENLQDEPPSKKPKTDSPASIGGLKEDRFLTSKTLERVQAIVSLAQQHKLILFPDLMKLIYASEEKKYDTMIDRKTVKRLLERLDHSKKVKLYKTTIHVQNKTRDLFYICDPSVTPDSVLMQSSLEQQRTDLTASTVKASTEKKKVEKPAKVKEKPEPEEDISSYTVDRNIAFDTYGFAAKMKRAEILHSFLCYVVYNYEGRTDIVPPAPNLQIVEKLSGSISDDYSHLPVYHNSLTWKRFIPPNILVDTKNRNGCAYLMDLGSQLPLYVFLTLVKIRYKVQAIVDYLNDPIKRLIPVKHLPLKMQAPLLHKRLYVTKIKDTVGLLCMMGLVTNIATAEGGVTYKEMNVIYLHKTAIIRNTMQGPFKGNETEAELAEKTLVYNFVEHDAVDEFWVQLKSICVNTPVPRTKTNPAQESDEKQSRDLLRKESLRESCVPRKLEDIKEGVIPGDGQGAGGLDTLHYAHLSRSWTSLHEKIVPNTKTKAGVLSVSLNPKQQPSTITVTPSIIQVKLPVASDVASNPTLASDPLLLKKINTPLRRGLDQRALKRPATLTAKEKQAIRKEKNAKRKNDARRERNNDVKDAEAKALLETARAIFSTQEDEIIILCKVGLNILGCKEVARKNVRDFLHKALPHISCDKSSTSCWARLCRITQFGKKDNTIKLYTSIALRNPEIAKYRDKEPFMTSDTFGSTYSHLMDEILKTCGNVSNMTSAQTIDLSKITDLAMMDRCYDVIEIADDSDTSPVGVFVPKAHDVAPTVVTEWKHPTTENEVAKYTLSNFIVGYLLLSDKINRVHQMHKVFEQYPQSLSEVVLKSLRENKIATLRKEHTKYSGRKFALTFRYKLFADKCQVVASERFLGCGAAYNSLFSSQGSVQYDNDDDWHGRLMMFIDMLPIQAINYAFALPDNVLDMANLQSYEDDEDDEDIDDGGNDKEIAEKNRLKFENCQIKPCTISVSLAPEKLPEPLLRGRKDDRTDVQHIMSAVPMSHDAESAFKTFESNPSLDVSFMKQVFNWINQFGFGGVSEKQLLSHFTGFSENEVLKLNSALKTLMEVQLVLAVGVTDRHYVSISNIRMWTIHSLRDTKGRGSGVLLTEEDKVCLPEESVEKSEETNPLMDINPTAKKPATTFTRIDIIPKPWLTPEGTINYSVLYRLLTSILSTLYVNGSCKFDALHEKFGMVYSQAALLDLLQILIDIGSVQKFYVTKENSPASLFSRRGSLAVSELPMSSISVVHYEVKPQGLVRLGAFMNNTSQKTNS